MQSRSRSPSLYFGLRIKANKKSEETNKIERSIFRFTIRLRHI